MVLVSCFHGWCDRVCEQSGDRSDKLLRSCGLRDHYPVATGIADVRVATVKHERHASLFEPLANCGAVAVLEAEVYYRGDKSG
jgi:hypothetical protein